MSKAFQSKPDAGDVMFAGWSPKKRKIMNPIDLKERIDERNQKSSEQPSVIGKAYVLTAVRMIQLIFAGVSVFVLIAAGRLAWMMFE